MAEIELGLDTFGDVTVDDSGQPLSQAQTLRNVVAEGELADQVGLAFFGVGEHHRPDFSVSAPEVVLAAIAGKTSRIHLGSAVTVLSSDDAVRVAAIIWKDNRSEGASLYFLDPDGHRLELHVGTLASRLAHYSADASSGVTVL